MRLSQKTPFQCCNMNLTWKLKVMKVYKDNTLSRKFFIKKNKLNSHKKFNSLLSRLMMKNKACRKELMKLSNKNQKLKSKSLHSHIKKIKYQISPNKKIKNSHLSKIKFFNWLKKLKKSNNSVEPKSLKFKISSWKKSLIMKKKLP